MLSSLHQGFEMMLVSIPQQKPLVSLYLQSHQTLRRVLFHQTGTWWIDSHWSEEPVMKIWHKLIMLS